jgi:hypothetical protein
MRREEWMPSGRFEIAMTKNNMITTLDERHTGFTAVLKRAPSRRTSRRNNRRLSVLAVTFDNR